jgi:restriction system protein
MKKKGIPKRSELFIATIEALKKLGGSGSISDINEEVINILRLPDNLVNLLHKTNTGKPDNRTELEYELAWTRTNLKKKSVVEKSSRGIWALTDFAKSDVKMMVDATNQDDKNSTDNELTDEDFEWKNEVIKVLTEEISPSEFERLIQRVLRESGFEQVEVTGRTNDGGIDGRGIARINGILSFHILFQCKRYKNSVSSNEIRDFRGAMVGRTDKGLFVTTGKFTREAVKEANRDGAPIIDLVDGEKLAEKLKELKLGIDILMVEKIVVNKDWFLGL